MKLVKNLANNRKVIFDKGKFDDWCVYVVENNGQRNAPKDKTYFTDLMHIDKFYTHGKVYNDFVDIYEMTNKKIDNSVLMTIDNLCSTYNEEHQLIMQQWFTVLYASMIAEENKSKAILKKRIKRLGVYQVLKEGMQPETAAEFSKGKDWQVLNELMNSYGF